MIKKNLAKALKFFILRTTVKIGLYNDSTKSLIDF